MGGALGSYYWPSPLRPHSGTAGRSEQGRQPVICTWAQASVAPNRYLRMCFLLELAAEGVGAGRAWRNVAGQRVSLVALCPAGQPVGVKRDGTGPCLPSTLGTCLGDILTFCFQLFFSDASGVGKFLAWMEVWRLKGISRLRGGSGSPLPSCCVTWLPGMELVL